MHGDISYQSQYQRISGTFCWQLCEGNRNSGMSLAEYKWILLYQMKFSNSISYLYVYHFT